MQTPPEPHRLNDWQEESDARRLNPAGEPPLISVVIPSYNSAKYIRPTCSSIMNRQHTHLPERPIGARLPTRADWDSLADPGLSRISNRPARFWLATVQNSDRTLLLNEQRLVAMDTHRELLVGNDDYRELVANQQIIASG